MAFIQILDSLFSENRLGYMFKTYKSSIIDVTQSGLIMEQMQISISNVIFSNNVGIGISLNFISAVLLNVSFTNNTALFGAGMNIKSSLVQIQNVSLSRNTGFFGGVIFIPSGYFCTKFIYNNNASADLVLSENNANANIYIDDQQCVKYLHLDNFTIENNPSYLTTGPHSLKLNENSSPIHVFPGQKIVFSVTVLDSFGHNTTSCIIAIPTLECSPNKPSFNCRVGNTTLKLNIEDQLFLKTNKRFDSGLHLNATHEFIEHSEAFRIKFTCAKTLVSAYLFVSMSMCPLGYVFTKEVCKCIEDEDLTCSVEEGVACVKKGNWYGSIRINNKMTNTTVPCSHPYCILSEPCPLNGYRDTFMKLYPEHKMNSVVISMEESCVEVVRNKLSLHLGLVSVYHYQVVRNGWPYTVLSLAVVFQIALVMFIFLFLKHIGRFGVGYLYGPLFFPCSIQVITTFIC